MITCTGCGLPRAESESEKPCPVCASAGELRLRSTRPEPSPDALSYLPADVSQLSTANDVRQSRHRPEIIWGVLGVIVGACLVLALTPLFEPAHPPVTAPVVLAPPIDVVPTPAPSPAEPAASTSVAAISVPAIPLAYEAQGVDEANPPEEAAMPRLVELAPLPPGNQIVVDLDLPDGNFSFPNVPYRPGSRFVLRGRVRNLHITPLEAGTVLDASGLVVLNRVSIMRVTGATVKVHAPGAEVTMVNTIAKGSEVVIDAPRGLVTFKNPGNNKLMTRLEGNSKLTVTGQTIVFFGPISGDNNRVDVTITDGGLLKIPSVEGASIVEYRKGKPDDPAPQIDVGSTANGAIVRRVE